GMCARTDVLRLMREAGPPWNVTLVAQKAGIQALREDDYLQKARDLIFVQREKLRQQLIGLGYWVLEAAANYLLFQVRELEDPAYIDEFTSDLLEDGI
ncbi:threonine-phosphate decarboxylase, partial [Eubacteriales bacterium DFI.9.88]|nr:threonine-phosphate decarboxylase [Eubacteriales bacterium DFI.9.88]